MSEIFSKYAKTLCFRATFQGNQKLEKRVSKNNGRFNPTDEKDIKLEFILEQILYFQYKNELKNMTELAYK